MDISDMIKNLLSDGGLQKLLPVLNVLRENSFDIKKVLQNLTPESVMQVFQSFMSQNSDVGKAEQEFTGYPAGVSAIANVADKEIVYVLNRYLSSENSF